ncbi:MAG: hypothetical protein ACW99U_12690 [Candidatus Thorarchaeota archaeon]|jgi:hypothetical protein
MTAPSKTWKQFERQLGEWWRGKRNPLSGRNNIDDRGNRRLGDVIVPELEAKDIPYLIEAKLHKNIASITRAKETMALAEEHGIGDWFHFERKNGSNKIVLVATSPEWMERIVHFIMDELKEKT